MFMPYGTGALLVRDGEALRAAHEATADYLPHTTRTISTIRASTVPTVARISRAALWLSLNCSAPQAFAPRSPKNAR